MTNIDETIPVGTIDSEELEFRRVRREWTVHEDTGLAIQLQNQEVQSHYDSNRQNRRLVRSDREIAADLQRDELIKRQKKELMKSTTTQLASEILPRQDNELYGRISECTSGEVSMSTENSALTDEEIARKLQEKYIRREQERRQRREEKRRLKAEAAAVQPNRQESQSGDELEDDGSQASRPVEPDESINEITEDSQLADLTEDERLARMLQAEEVAEARRERARIEAEIRDRHNPEQEILDAHVAHLLQEREKIKYQQFRQKAREEKQRRKAVARLAAIEAGGPPSIPAPRLNSGEPSPPLSSTSSLSSNDQGIFGGSSSSSSQPRQAVGVMGAGYAGSRAASQDNGVSGRPLLPYSQSHQTGPIDSAPIRSGYAVQRSTSHKSENKNGTSILDALDNPLRQLEICSRPSDAASSRQPANSQRNPDLLLCSSPVSVVIPKSGPVSPSTFQMAEQMTSVDVEPPDSVINGEPQILRNLQGLSQRISNNDTAAAVPRNYFRGSKASAPGTALTKKPSR